MQRNSGSSGSENVRSQLVARDRAARRLLDRKAAIGRHAARLPVRDVLGEHRARGVGLVQQPDEVALASGGGDRDVERAGVHAAHQNTGFIALSTLRFPWNNGSAQCDDKHMVSKNSGPKTATGLRLEQVRRETGCRDKAAFARWVGLKNPQNLAAWVARDKIPGDGALQVNRATGADTHWLMTGEGEPFPRGATPYPGAATAGDGRMRALEAHVDALSSAVAQLVQVVSQRLPGAGVEIAAALRTQAVDPRGLLPELAVVVAAAEAAPRSAAPATRRAAPAGSAGKPPRKGR